MWVLEGDEYLGQLSTWNRAAQFGDGLFETLIIESGNIRALELHLARMERGFTVLDLQLPKPSLKKVVLDGLHGLLRGAQLEQQALSRAVLKVVARRADSARGYGYKDNKAVFTFMLSEAVSLPDEYYEQGIDVQVCKTQCSIQPQLAGLKHLNRLENVLAKKELFPQNFEGMMLNASGHVIEGTMSNVFFEKNQALCTPKLNASGVNGVMRQLVMNYCQAHNIPVNEVDVTESQMADYDCVFVCNSVIGILPVKKIEQKNYKLGSVMQTLKRVWQNGDIYE